MATICEVDQLLTGARTCPNITALAPCDEPKFAPVIVKLLPTGPAVGDKPVILGAVELTAPPVAVVCPQIEPVHALIVTEPVPTPYAKP